MTVSRPTSAPTTRPVLPRTSSAASGFFFCGMIEEPVVKRSDSFTKPNCGVVHSTISSASRERWVAAMAAAASTSSAKSRADDRIERIAHGAGEAERRGGRVAVDRETGAGEGGRAERALVEPGAGIGETAAVARDHLDISQEMMAEGDRLRALEMGEARHHRAGIGQRLRRERGLQAGKGGVDPVDGIADPEPEIGRDLIVARAGGVQAAGGRADQFGQAGLDVEVDVFERARECELARLDLDQHVAQPLGDGPRIGLRQDALRGQHGDMGLRAADILSIETPVEIDRGIDRLERGVGSFRKSPAPHLVTHHQPLRGAARTST